MKTLRQLWRLIVTVVGFTVLAVGVAMIVLPGPAIVVIPTGLAILAAKFAWARNLLKKMKGKLRRQSEPGSTESNQTDPRA